MRIQYINDETGSFQEVHGSDSRMNVSSRVDGRPFYVSRDQGQAYVLRVEDDDAASGDLVAYLRNDSKVNRMYIQDIHVQCENAAEWKLAYGDGTTATGTTVTAVNLNKTSSNDADATGLGNGAIGGVTASTFFSTRRHIANSQAHFHFGDALILGQNDNIVVELDLISSTGDIEVDIYFFIE